MLFKSSSVISGSGVRSREGDTHTRTHPHTHTHTRTHTAAACTPIGNSTGPVVCSTSAGSTGDTAHGFQCLVGVFL